MYWSRSSTAQLLFCLCHSTANIQLRHILLPYPNYEQGDWCVHKYFLTPCLPSAKHKVLSGFRMCHLPTCHTNCPAPQGSSSAKGHQVHHETRAPFGSYSHASMCAPGRQALMASLPMCYSSTQLTLQVYTSMEAITRNEKGRAERVFRGHY